MMSADVTLFRSLALSFPKAVENAHCNHPDLRLHNRIFATLSKEAGGYGVLMLTPEQQSAFLSDLPAVFEPVPGGWGRRGATLVHLAAADRDTLLGALTTAYRNAEAKQAAAENKRAIRKRRPTIKS